MTSMVRPPQGGGSGTGGTTSRPVPTDTLITIVLDKSGSMGVVRQATVDGFNRFKHDQLEMGDGALVSLTLFDSEVNEVCSAVPLRELVDLSGTTYQPNGCTALYDAVGAAITRTDALIATKAVDAQRVLFAIITDGEENASRHYERDAIFDMVREHERAGWSFVFLGANIDSYAASRSVGVAGASRSRDWVATPVEMERNMRVFSAATKRYRSASVVDAVDAARPFFAEEDEKAGED
jgi:hypothetical protein